MLVLFQLLIACRPPLADTGAPDTGTTGSGTTDTFTGTDTSTLVCTPWALDPPVRIEAAALFGDAVPADGAHDSGPGIALADLDGDGDQDALFAINSPFSVGLRNDGTGTLTPDPTLALLDGSPLPVGNAVATADLDDNGTVDIALGGPSGKPDVVLYNDGSGRFEQVDLPESTGETMGLTLGDVNGDGRLDILTAGFNMVADQEDIEPGAHLGDGSWIYLQEPDRGWRDGRAGLPEYTLYDLTYQFAVLDADRDGDDDLFVSNDHGVGTGFPNYLLGNDGSGTFVGQPASGAQQRTNGMGAAVGDPDGNGAPDLYLANWGGNNLYLNTGVGTFYDASDASGVRMGPNGSDGIAYASRFIDLDGDTWEELAVMFGVTSPLVIGLVPEAQPDLLFHNDGDGHFTDISDTSGFDSDGWGRGLASGDLNGDGVADLVAAERIGLLVYLGRGGCPGPVVRLDAGPGNREGIGAEVRVQTNLGRSYTRWMLPAATLSQSAAELYLGLGGAARATVEVSWPDGRTTTHDVEATDRVTFSPG